MQPLQHRAAVKMLGGQLILIIIYAWLERKDAMPVMEVRHDSL